MDGQVPCSWRSPPRTSGSHPDRGCARRRSGECSAGRWPADRGAAHPLARPRGGDDLGLRRAAGVPTRRGVARSQHASAQRPRTPARATSAGTRLALHGLPVATDPEPHGNPLAAQRLRDEQRSPAGRADVGRRRATTATRPRPTTTPSTRRRDARPAAPPFEGVAARGGSRPSPFDGSLKRQPETAGTRFAPPARAGSASLRRCGVIASSSSAIVGA
jgi:hypothetical protein